MIIAPRSRFLCRPYFCAQQKQKSTGSVSFLCFQNFKTRKTIATMPVNIGEQAPAFTLFSSEKTPVSLADYKGKNVVLLFFPLAFTSVCTAEMCDTRDNISLFNHLNAEVLGVSVDSPFTLRRFREEFKLNFPLLSDFNKTVSEAYGALYQDFILGMKGVSKRAAFVIDGNGIVRYAEVLENAGNLPNFAAIKETLSGLNQLVG